VTTSWRIRERGEYALTATGICGPIAFYIVLKSSPPLSSSGRLLEFFLADAGMEGPSWFRNDRIFQNAKGQKEVPRVRGGVGGIATGWNACVPIRPTAGRSEPSHVTSQGGASRAWDKNIRKSERGSPSQFCWARRPLAGLTSAQGRQPPNWDGEQTWLEDSLEGLCPF